MIHVCFGLHDKTGRYSKFTGTAMLSIFDNHIPPPTVPSITVHILHDNTLSTDNRDKFFYLAGQYAQTVKFYNVEKICADKINKMIELVPTVKNARVSVGAFYRLIIPQVLPSHIGKCIYLDSDMFVNLDINDLWRVDIGDKPLASVPEVIASNVYFKNFCARNYMIRTAQVKVEDYFNSGIIMMNLNYLRNAEDFIMSGVKWRGENPQCTCFDQDIWNHLFAKNYFKLPEKFDQFVRDERASGRSSRVRQVIYHFAGDTLNLNTKDPLNRLWMDYFIRTPFFDAMTIGRLNDGFNKTQFELKRLLINLSVAMSNKARAFFTAPDNVNAIKGIFSVRNDEEIILAKDNESLKKLLIDMSTSRGKKIFFIIFPNFPFEVLTKFGFVQGKDFVNGMEFLSEAHGIQFNSHPLIRAM